MSRVWRFCLSLRFVDIYGVGVVVVVAIIVALSFVVVFVRKRGGSSRGPTGGVCRW